ncbi:MAG: signal peptide peptidase SppA [Pseudomonadota bacterium]
MSMTPDQIIDRRRLRRKLTFWRLGAFMLMVAFLTALSAASGLFDNFSRKSSDHIARVKISGFIGNNREMVELMEELGKKNSVKAVLLDVSSPGGSTVGGEAIYEAVRKLTEKKPVVTSVGTLAASAGYMVACGSDYIVAHRSSLLGSIGVLIQYGDVSRLFEKLGVEVDSVKSSPLKAEPSPFSPASEEARQMLENVVNDSYEWFVKIVAERRSLSPIRARQVSDGSIFTGSQSVENGLIDAIGNEDDARDWLVENKGIESGLKFVEWKTKSRRSSGLLESRAILQISKWFGFDIDNQAADQLRELLPRPLFLDGLVSVLQTPSDH